MTPEQWRRVGQLFHEALDVPVDARDGWAEVACAGDIEVRRELLSLLENDRAAASGLVEGHVKKALLDMFDDPPAGRRRVGLYRLLRELGRGGMGTVYLAERDDAPDASKVAIKLVRPGMDTGIVLHRFRRERRILAQLQHPHIARLIDGGNTADELPYIVMEYIDGVTITEYVKQRRLGIAECLRLFLDVCAAVEYAHRNFVVHRDIKPGNILVSADGTVKLLDFGICKLLHTEANLAVTASRTLHMLTPDYASPEQVRGDPITIASDIYSLAAVLYELLTGRKPHRIVKFTPQAVERAICDEEIARPGLADDLDTVLMYALQKDPARRYGSVEQFAEDIRRYLAHQPVKARPDTLMYRARKFAQRQRKPLAAAAFAVAMLVAGLVVSSRDAREARVELAAALRRLAVAEAVNGRRDAALAQARRAVEISDAASGSATMGLVFAALARSGGNAEDRRQAREWLRRSLEAGAPRDPEERRMVESAAEEMK